MAVPSPVRKLDSSNQSARERRPQSAINSDSKWIRNRQPLAPLLMLIDALLIGASVMLALMIRFPGNFNLPGMRDLGNAGKGTTLLAHVGFMLVYTVMVVLFCDSRRLYASFEIHSIIAELRTILMAVITSSFLLTGMFYLTGNRTVSRIVLVLTGSWTVILLTLWRYWRRDRSLRRLAAGQSGCNVLIVGTGEVGRALAKFMTKNPQAGYRVKGFLENSSQRWTQGQVTSAADGNEGDIKVLGHVDSVSDIARAHFVDEIIISLPHEHELVKKIASQVRENGLSVRVVPDLYDGLALGVDIEYIGSFPMLPLQAPHIPVVGLVLKRILDVMVSAVTLLLASPCMAVIAILIRLESPGSVLYRSPRVGRKGRIFTFYKFRSMVKNAEELKGSLRHLNERSGVLFKISNDPRITRLGRLLRKYSLDELPQFWNVLTGDMSLVGPRPPIPGEFEQYSLEHLRRLDVLPGITGLWQISARNNPSFESYISLDVEYVNQWDIWLDLRILLRTIIVVIRGTGK